MIDHGARVAGQVALDDRNAILHRLRSDLAIHPAVATAAALMPDFDTLDVVEEPEWCPDCHDTGWTVRNDDGAGAATRCDCKIPHYDGPASIPAADLQAYGCARSVSGDVASTWEPDRAVWPAEADAWPAGCRDPFGNRPKWLFIHGVVGNGKSRVAAWIMRRAMAKGVSCWWIDVPRTISEARAAIHDDEKQRTLTGAMQSRLSRQMVILDDIGAHRKTEWQVDDLVAAWVRDRHESGGWTVATSNLDPAGLRKFYPERTASRICAGKVLQMKGGDARRRTWETER